MLNIELTLRSQDPHLIIRTIADVNQTICIDEHPVGSIQPAFARLPIRPVTLFAVADESLDDTGRGADHADRVAFGIAEKNVAVRSQRDALGAGQLSLLGRTTVPAVPRFSCSRQMANGLCFQIECEDRVSFSQGKVEGVIAVKIESPRPIEGRVGERSTIGRLFLLACTGERADQA